MRSRSSRAPSCAKGENTSDEDEVEDEEDEDKDPLVGTFVVALGDDDDERDDDDGRDDDDDDDDDESGSPRHARFASSCAWMMR